MKNLPVLLLIILLLSLLSAGCKEDTSSSNFSPVTDIVQTPSPQTDTVKPEDLPDPEPIKPDTEQDNPSSASAVPNQQSYSWWFNRNNDHQIPSVPPEVQSMLADNSAFYVLPNSNNKIYLTFDEGYENGYTSQILDILKDNNVQAAFFITGHYLKSQPELVKRMKNEGHLVCNHTLNHPDLSTVSKDKFEQEVTSLENDFRDLTSLEMDKYLRPPMGNYSPASLGYAKDMDYSTVFWSMALKDWDVNNQPGAEYSYQHVVQNIHPGAVILLHAVSQSNTEALDRIIKDLTAQGYTFALFD